MDLPEDGQATSWKAQLRLCRRLGRPGKALDDAVMKLFENRPRDEGLPPALPPVAGGQTPATKSQSDAGTTARAVLTPVAQRRSIRQLPPRSPAANAALDGEPGRCRLGRHTPLVGLTTSREHTALLAWRPPPPYPWHHRDAQGAGGRGQGASSTILTAENPSFRQPGPRPCHAAHSVATDPCRLLRHRDIFADTHPNRIRRSSAKPFSRALV